MSITNIIPFFETEEEVLAYEAELESLGHSIEEGPEILLPENMEMNTSWSPLIKIPKLGHSAGSHNPPCSSNDANCEYVKVQLTLGAQVHAIRYYMNRSGTSSSRVRETRPREHQWAKIYRATQYNDGGFTWVRAKYKNWRKSYDRWGRLAVDWTLPT